MQITDLTQQAREIIARAEAADVTVDDGNVVDLIADNTSASLPDIRSALVAAGLATRFPRATAPRFFNIEYSVLTHFLPALINDDETGLTDEEQKQLGRWVERVTTQDAPAGYVFAHWATSGDEEDTHDEFGLDEVTGLRGSVETIQAVYRRTTEEN